MSNSIIKGTIQDYNRSEKYDDEGIKYILYWIKVNGNRYSVKLPENTNIYFGNDLYVVLHVNENNEAIAGICPKSDYKWGKIGVLKNEIKEADNYELVRGTVVEKRKETFNRSRGTADVYGSSWKTTVTYTIVLPEKNFRVVEEYGKHIKPNTEIIALLDNNVAYIIKDLTNNKVYGKPKKTYIIAILLLLAFNSYMYYMHITKQKDIFISFKQVMIIGNIVFVLALLISFSSYISSIKTYKIFKEMLNETY